MRWSGRPGPSLAAAVFVALALVVGGCAEASSGPPAGRTTASPTPSPSSSPRPPEVPAPGDHQLVLDHNGDQVRYELHAPPTYRAGRKLPLVVAIHYRGGNVASMRQMTRLDAKADKEGFLVAYPCCGSTEDVAAVKAIADHVIARWGADPARVYATGISAGADTAVSLAVEAPGVFAAIATVSGGFRGHKVGDDPTYKPSTPVSVLSFVGTDDRLADSIETGLTTWRRKVRCAAGAPTWVDPGKTVNRTAARCADGSEVLGYTITGMGHSWPGGAQAGLGDPTVKINASDVIWTFFEAHPRRR